MNIQVKAPDVGHIIVAGPTQIGKSIVLARITEVLEQEFGATVVNLEEKRTDLDGLKNFEVDLVKKTTWVLSESNIPRT